MKAFTLTILMTLAAIPVFAFNLADAANTVSSMQNQQQGQVQAPTAQADLLNLLGSQLNITPEQAVGGAGAMLGLARNNLSSDNYQELANAIPGLDLLTGANALGGLNGLGKLLGGNQASASALDKALGNDVEKRGDLDDAFKALGMDTGMIGQFAPLILQYLGQQGIAGPLLQNLGSLWAGPTQPDSV